MKAYTEKDLVKFGNYLLSNKRKVSDKASDVVNDTDIANSNIKAMDVSLIIKLNEELTAENIRLIEELDKISTDNSSQINSIKQVLRLYTETQQKKWWYKLFTWLGL